MIMGDGIGNNFATSDLNSKIKNEPKEEDELYDTEKPDYQMTKSLVIRFVKNQKGCYSVVPLIKPDPFFEEHLDDLCCEDVLDEIKIEEGSCLNYVNQDEKVVKQEKPDGEDKHSKAESNLTKTEKHLKERNELRENTENSSYSSQCSICNYMNTKKLVIRHIQRVHVSITKHSCPFCDEKNFKEPMSVDCHILKSHRDIDGAIDRIRRSIFECTFCHYKTLKRNNFQRHLTTHGDSRLRKHLDMKEDEKKFLGTHSKSKQDIQKALSTIKYDCFDCPYTTKDKGSIIKHVRLHREATQLPFCCRGCSKKFNEKNSLDSHIVKRHIENEELLKLITNRVYECEMCNYKDVNKNKVIRHKEARHVKKERKRKKKKGRNSKIKLKIGKK